ncbi:protein TBATA isoform X3 [Gopherus evgoodei]|uniref:protein TBATA isoform X3 n=1 Tax=Gopherus evgoodei TaxID=1825980 RepID=UPI0011CF5E20|nr:protein TBATA isoform X3 [Gopherus evgoodei]
MAGMGRITKMATEIKNLEPVLQQLETKCISAKEKMEMLRSPVAGPVKGKDITALAGKLKHVALNMPLRFSTEATRPQSKNNSRFGNLSHHSFFSRHNPHPHRVTHIQGLNGVPICIVNDGWSVLTPLSPHPMIKGSLSDAWREELRELAARVSASSSTEMEQKEVAEEPRRATQYSAETGRLIPPSSRATVRHTPQQLCRNNAKNKGKDAALSFQDQELVILELLCQILQTDSLSAIQQWLLTAGQREKDLVMRMLQTATANLQPEPKSLSTNLEQRLQSQMSQTAVGLSSRGQHLGRNHPVRLSQSQKQEPIPEEDKPVHMGTAEVLQFHLFRDGKQNQPDPPN